MINRPQSIRVKKYARRQMIFNQSQHALYGMVYVNDQEEVVEELAKTPEQIKYFYNDTSYNNCINHLHNEYKDVHELAVHRKDYM